LNEKPIFKRALKKALKRTTHEETKMRIVCYIRCNKTFDEVSAVLARSGFACHRFMSEIPLLRALRREMIDLILTDNAAGPADDTPFYSWLNCRTHDSIPVVLLSGSLDARAIALALNAGVDDYIDRPCEPEVLVARLRAILRRSRTSTRANDRIEMLGFTLDKNPQRVLDRGVPVELTPREFALAWLLFSGPGQFLSRQTISVAIWAVGDEIAKHSIEQHVYKLRKKLNLNVGRGVYIKNLYTKGYCLERCAETVAQA
jgi:DNA-binding response OmpR family regulator